MHFFILFDELLVTNEIIFFSRLEIMRYYKRLIFWICKSLERRQLIANNTSLEQYVISIITEHYLRYHQMTHVMYIFTQSENSNDVYSSSVYVLESSYISKVWQEKNNINLNFHLCTKCKFEFSTSKILKFHALNLKIIYNI